VSDYDVIILGAGAAGLMCASEAAGRGRKVLVLEKGARPAPKILVSGGGRCNFTNIHAKAKDYVTTNPAFVPYALSKFTSKDFLALVKAKAIPYHEKKDGQLFCDKSSKNILDMMVARAEEKGANILKGQDTQEVSQTDGLFTVKTQDAAYSAPRLVVATGGLSWPQLGASDLGYKLAQQFGLKVIEPAPALVGLTFPADVLLRFEGLSGIHLRVGVSCGKWNMVEDLMITHEGLSGPVILNASLIWRPGQEIVVNWLPDGTVDTTLERLKKDKAKGGRGEFRDWLSEQIPRRLADRLAYHAGARGSWPQLSDESLKQLAEHLHAYRFVPADTFGYKRAEVTKGGVDTRELSRDTMECRKIPGLYFIGEVMDVTGKLGGYNFQWAWSTGWTAGQSV
jgi:hypothetical protein